MFRRMIARPEQFVYVLGLTLYPLLVLAAAAGWQLVFGIAALATFGLEATMPSRAGDVYGVLRLAASGWTLRALLRSLALVVIVATSATDTVGLVVVALSMFALEAMRSVLALLAVLVTRARTLHMVTRNVDLSRLQIPDRSRRLAQIDPRRIAYLGALPVVGTIVSAVSDDGAAVVIGAAAAAAIAAVATAIGAADTVAARRMPRPKLVTQVISKAVTKFAPEVVIYFSGTSDSVYQINMWLKVAERLEQRVLIIVRERLVLAEIGPTSLPIVCIPSPVDLMEFDLPSVRVALYPANVGKNIHFLRLPGIRHVFIGHGDSDKVASINPFCKAYDEVWVAGAAGRERFARAAIGVDDEDIFEVGRPQLAGIRRESTDRGGPLTVLYAPTWEGWTDAPQNSSLVSMGPAIAEHVLNHSDNVRLIYKPHPLTGTRSPAARAANEKIIELINEANMRRSAVMGASATCDRAIVDQLTMIVESIDATAVGTDADEAMIARDSAQLHQDAAARAGELATDWSRIYWAAQPNWAHRVVTAALPTLFDCFNHTDLLVTDISSVVADYLYSEKPYVVTNSGARPHTEFRSLYPTAGAAELLDPDCATLAGIVAEIGSGIDRFAQRRRELKEYLIGPDEAVPFEGFRAAVDRAAVTARRAPLPRVTLDEFDRERAPVDLEPPLDLGAVPAEAEA